MSSRNYFFGFISGDRNRLFAHKFKMLRCHAVYYSTAIRNTSAGGYIAVPGRFDRHGISADNGGHSAIVILSKLASTNNGLLGAKIGNSISGTRPLVEIARRGANQ
jgi:hypothetical protein